MSLPPMAYYTVAKKPNLGYHDFKNLFNFEAKTLRPCGICSPLSFLFVWSTITQLFSSTVHTRNKQWTAVDKSLLHQEIRISPKKIFETPRLKPQVSWVRSANVTTVQCYRCNYLRDLIKDTLLIISKVSRKRKKKRKAQHPGGNRTHDLTSYRSQGVCSTPVLQTLSIILNTQLHLKRLHSLIN